ncbi:MAG TPA: hypothetical protein V6D48_16250 [Oculatellaceae cyanobacterium]
MKLDDSEAGRSPDKHENLIQLLALLTTLIIFLTFAISLTLARVWKLQQIIETELIDK